MRRDCLKVTPISPLFMTAGVLRQIKCLCVCAVSLRMWNMLLFVIQRLRWTLSASYTGYDLDAVAYFGALSHFPGFLLTWEKKKAHWLSLKISSGLCERSPPRATQEFLVWERPKSCTIRTFDIFSAIDISLNWDLTKTSAGRASLSWQMSALALWTDWTVAQLKQMQSSGLLCFS